jgi:phospholipid/cholesterol/gamma-HCH transport system permease protein
MSSDAPRIASTRTAAGLRHELLGEWTAVQLSREGACAQAQSALLEALRQGAPWDLRGLVSLDHVGAQLLWNAWGHAWPAGAQALPFQRAMLERVARFSSRPLPAPPFSLWAYVDALGAWVLLVLSHLRGLLRLIGQLALDSLTLLRAPQRGPWRDMSGHLYHMGATSLPITALVGFLIGVVLAYLMSQQLQRFGADSFIVDILGLALIRELGPALAAILVAGRSGSAITAQIGVMRVTEELDAMRVMGIAHGYRLVLPRAIALAIAMPLLAVWTILAALAGGILATYATLDISPQYFIDTLPRVVQAVNLYLALGKSALFGVLIALVGCHFGLRVLPNTESLGQGTTASVVTSITVVLLVDAMIAVVFRSVGI